MSSPESNPDPRPQIAAARCILRRKLLVRLVASVFLAAVVAAALAAKPGRIRQNLYAQLPGRDLIAISHRYGWPEGIACFNELVWRYTNGQTVPFDPRSAPPQLDLRFLAFLGGNEGWQVYVHAACILYLACLASVFALLAVRPLVTYRRTKRRLETALCPHCGYPTFGLPERRCPECGGPVSR